MSNRQRTAIVLTECNVQRNATFSHTTKAVSVPVSRIAKVEEWKTNLDAVPESERENQPQSRITLRTPEDGLLVRESVEMVNARMNGDETFRDTAGRRHEAARG